MPEKNEVGDTTNNNVISQWGWIAKYCENKSMIDSALLAKAIDRIEKYLYGNERAEAWERFVEEHKNSGDEEVDIYLIANRGEFSVPCTKQGFKNFKCDECEFAKIAGKCHEKDSLSNIFGRSLTQFLVTQEQEQENKR